MYVLAYFDIILAIHYYLYYPRVSHQRLNKSDCFQLLLAIYIKKAYPSFGQALLFNQRDGVICPIYYIEDQCRFYSQVSLKKFRP